MKIGHFVSYYLPVTQNWIYNQLIYNRECEPMVLCQRLINPELFPLDRIYPICRPSGLMSTPRRLIHKFFERYPYKPHSAVIKKKKPDILHGHFLLESWRNYHLVKRLNIPLITTCYGQDITSLPRRPFWRGRCKKVFDLSAAFIVEGGYMGKTLAELGCPQEKINVIKLGIDIAKIDAHTGIAKKDSKVRILFTGLNREKKGAAYAAKAFIKALSMTGADLELHLLGDGIYRKPLEKMLSEADVRQKAVFHGMRPVDKYLELLKSTDITLTPSVHASDGDTEGGAPVVTIESLCAGIPVVGSRHCDIPNIVSHGSTGLLSNERDTDALAKDICTLAENPSLRLEMGERGMRYARAEHDIEKQVRKITDVYRGVLSL